MDYINNGFELIIELHNYLHTYLLMTDVGVALIDAAHSPLPSGVFK